MHEVIRNSTERSADAAFGGARRHVPTDDEAMRFVHDLVSTPSISGAERPAVDVFVRMASAWGLETCIDEVGNGVAIRRGESIADDHRSKELVLLGHIDTVAGHIPVRIENGVLHGRGSVDAKGPLAAMLTAAARADVPPNCIVRVVAAVGEETPHSTGARHIAATCQPDACIIGEPSGWTGVTLGYKGRLVMHVSNRQPSAHSAGPGGSAADTAVQLWWSVRSMIERMNTGHEGSFETIQATVRSLATSSNGLHDLAQLSAGFRLPRWITPHELEAKLRGLAQEIAGTECSFEGHELCHASERNDLVARALSAGVRSTGQRPHPKLKTGTADLNVVAPVWKCPIAAYGAGDSSLDHTPMEHLVLDEYCKSIRVLEVAIRGILSELKAQHPE